MMQQYFGFLVLLLISVSNPFTLTGQNSLRVNEEFKELPLKEVLEILKDNYQLKFTFQHKAVQNITVDKQINDLPLSFALDQILSETNLIYKVLENREVLIRKAPRSENRQLIGLRGRVLDEVTQTPLAFASILYGENKGIESDQDGFFSLDFKPKVLPESIKVVYLGYEEKVFEIDPSKRLNYFTIHLHPEVNEIGGVIITEQEPILKRTDKKTGSTKANVEKLATLPSFVIGDDPMRNLQLLPGINAADDLSSELKVRGSNGDENIIILDGIPLFNVSHYFGVFSLINPAFSNKIQLYKNIFPIEYGGRIASVVDISSAPLTNKKIKGGVELNLLTTNAYLELPLGQKAGLKLGGRLTNKNVADTKLFSLLDQQLRTTRNELQGNDANIENSISGLEPNFQFNDFNAKLEWQLGPKTDLNLSFFSGFDQFDYKFEQTIERPSLPSVLFEFNEESNWENIGASFRLNHEWNDQLQSSLALSKSRYNTFEGISALYTRFVPQMQRFKTNGHNISNHNSVEGLEIRQKNEWQLDENKQLDFGWQFTDSQTQTLLENERERILEVDNAGKIFSLFAEYSQTIAKRLHFSVGLRPSYLNSTQKVYWSPRLSLSYQAHPNFYLKASWSKYYQFLRRSFHENPLGRNYDFWVIPDENRFPVSSANNLMLGANWQNDVFELDIELYQKDINGVIEHAREVIGFDENDKPIAGEYRIFKGGGQTRGLDIMLKKSSGKYSAWMAYTLSKSDIWFPEINFGTPFPSPEDRRHQFKWVNQYRHKSWTFSLVYVMSSGQPFSDFTRAVIQPQDRTSFFSPQQIQYLQDYHRLDLGINYNFPLFKSRAEVGLSVFNALNRDNTKSRQYIFAFVTNANGIARAQVLSTELQMLGITPNVSFKINFGEN